MLNEQIKNLNEDFKNLTDIQNAYNQNFKNILNDFLKHHNLQNDVTRTVDNKTEKGKLEIINGQYKDYAFITSYIVFKPYKKDNELSAAHRIDKLELENIEEYFDKILKIYQPA